MPLVANTADNGTYQTPCPVNSMPVAPSGTATYVTHPCLLVAVNGKAQDSYSVLASFGAKFNANAKPDEATAGGGLAQYFATGVAAQLLALNGGAAVVAIGDAAKVAAATNASSKTLEALYGKDAAFTAGVAQATEYTRFRDDLLATIQLTDQTILKTKVLDFEKKTGVFGSIANKCDTMVTCKEAVIGNDAYNVEYTADPSKFNQALTDWRN